MTDLLPCPEETIPNHIQEMQDEITDLLLSLCDMPDMYSTDFTDSQE